MNAWMNSDYPFIHIENQDKKRTEKKNKTQLKFRAFRPRLIQTKTIKNYFYHINQVITLDSYTQKWFESLVKIGLIQDFFI